MAYYFALFPKKFHHTSILNGVIILVILSSAQFSQGHSYLEDKPCGILYSEANYEGLQYPINDHEQFINLQEDVHAQEDGWIITGSLKIESGCSMETCNEAYFGGQCQMLVAGDYPVTTNLNLSSFASASCTCVKECKCSDIFMKKSSCARAYLKGGCRTCHALYTDLEGSKTFFPEEFANNVEAFRLRKGCTLTLYSEEDFEGEEVIIDSEIVEDYQGEIHSYECECNDAEFETRIRPPRPSSYPPLVDIPGTMDDVTKALQNKEFSNHPGLRAAFNSMQNKRSSKNAYILMLGTSASGKTSALKVLFDNPNITKSGGPNYCQYHSIEEIRIPIPVDEIGVANSELRIIDTAGLGDTRGLEQDAKFLATLDHYLANHEELKDRIPNVVLIFHKFHDNRFNGAGSQFVKMLRGLDSFRERITDATYSNIIFVLSHFCSETRANKRRPETRLKQFKQIIQDCTLFPKPIHMTVAENKGREQDLPMVNGYFQLPNKEYYPWNLFEKMELVTENSGDVIGKGVFRTAFRDSADFNVSWSAFELPEKRNDKVGYYLSRLTNAVTMVAIQTEISNILEQVWDERVDRNVRKQFPHSLPYLQKWLNIRNVTTEKDIPRMPTAIFELFRSIRNDEGVLTLLEKALNITPSVFPQSTVAGHGYNVFNDSYLSQSPFKLEDILQSDIGFMIPKILTCKLERGGNEIFQVFDNMEQYLQHRLHSLGIEGTISKEKFTGAIKPGYNIKELSFKNDSCSLSVAREFRLFEFALNDRFKFTPAFTTTVKSLSTFNETDNENVKKWKQFFNEYGTHVVKSIYGGGAIEIKLHSNKPFNTDFAQAFFDLIKFTEDKSFLIDGESNSSNRTVLKQGIDHSLTFFGGDSAYHINDLTKMSVQEASKLFTNWKKSLKFNPIVLNSEMRLVPISQIVKRKLGQNYTSEIERAFTLLFKSGSICESGYSPTKKSSANPRILILPREETPLLSEGLKLQQQSNKKIQEIMVVMKKLEVEIEKRRQEKTLEWDRTKYNEDQSYKKSELEAQRLQEIQRQKLLTAWQKQRSELMKEIMNRPPPSTGRQ